MLTDGRTDGRTDDGRTDDGVTGILIAHLGAFGSGELINHVFSNLEGGKGVLPPKILKTKKAGEAISGRFVRTVLPSVNEQFLKILLPFIVCPFFF